MKLTKLTWAGVAISEGDKTLLIDPIASTKHIKDEPLVVKPGKPLEDFVPLDSFSGVCAVLITHFHPDHFDPVSIIEAFGSKVKVFIPQESVRVAVDSGLEDVVGVKIGDEYTVEQFKIVATYSVDGFGSPQVAWIVSANEKKVAHFGDTIWHGFWWKIARKYGPIDVACLPINGPVLSVPGLPRQSSLHAAMNPEEATEGAALLGVKYMLPIHYKTFNNPPYYIESSDVLERVFRRSSELFVSVLPLNPGESSII